MPFTPENSLLNTLDEFKNLSHKITYTGYEGSVATNYPVTVTAIDENDTINVFGDTISGYYSNSFEDNIHYRNKDDTFTTVNKFNQINIEKLYGIYHFDADSNQSVTYSYLAEANGDSKVYTIVVTNNWTNGRNQLLRYTNINAYEEITCSWNTGSGTTIPWKNINGENITWENNTWV